MHIGANFMDSSPDHDTQTLLTENRSDNIHTPPQLSDMTIILSVATLVVSVTLIVLCCGSEAPNKHAEGDEEDDYGDYDYEGDKGEGEGDEGEEYDYKKDYTTKKVSRKDSLLYEENDPKKTRVAVDSGSFGIMQMKSGASGMVGGFNNINSLILPDEQTVYQNQGKAKKGSGIARNAFSVDDHTIYDTGPKKRMSGGSHQALQMFENDENTIYDTGVSRKKPRGSIGAYNKTEDSETVYCTGKGGACEMPKSSVMIAPNYEVPTASAAKDDYMLMSKMQPETYEVLGNRVRPNTGLETYTVPTVPTATTTANSEVTKTATTTPSSQRTRRHSKTFSTASGHKHKKRKRRRKRRVVPKEEEVIAE